MQEWFTTYYGAEQRRRSSSPATSTPKTALAKVEKYFGDIPPGPPRRPAPGLDGQAHRRAAPDRRRTACRRRASTRSGTCRQWGTRRRRPARPGGRRARVAARPRGSTSGWSTTTRSPPTSAPAVDAPRDRRPVPRSRPTRRPGVDLAKVEKAIDEELAALPARRARPRRSSSGSKAQCRAGFVRGVERIGGFGGKSDVLAQSQVYARQPRRLPDARWRAMAATPPPQSVEAAPTLALRRRLRPRGAALPRATPRRQAAPTAQAVPSPGRRPTARFPTFERATLANGLKVVAGRAPRRPAWCSFNLLLDAGYAADQTGAARHGRAWPWTCSTRARATRTALADQRGAGACWAPPRRRRPTSTPPPSRSRPSRTSSTRRSTSSPT
ncbi:MAG: hypothetical protein MZV64_10655 [Ignavibacteriales bacterium]|nr:hypothetical protein [Ignavibacteriales bacterium]